MQSCLYVGHVQHRRLLPAKNEFRYRLYLAYLDLEELPELIGRRSGIQGTKFAPASFLRSDHLGNPRSSLSESVRDLVEQRGDRRPTGPIRLLTFLRHWGYSFSPLSLYYCFEEGGEQVDAVVAEVSNTPWLEHHWYVLDDRIRESFGPELQFRHPKGFHVSPFMNMNMDYSWRLSRPAKQLTVSIENHPEEQRPFFEVNLILKRRELNRANLRHLLMTHPWMSGQVVFYIYWQAFRLWRKRCPYYPHPENFDSSEGPSS